MEDTDSYKTWHEEVTSQLVTLFVQYYDVEELLYCSGIYIYHNKHQNSIITIFTDMLQLYVQLERNWE